ncbi:hypothetical protein N2152v2_005962 [Parachlorella kessleri]
MAQAAVLLGRPGDLFPLDAQAHAPLTAAQAGAAVTERFVYVLGCVADKCPGSWKVIRCQPPSAVPAAKACSDTPSGCLGGGQEPSRLPVASEPYAAGDSWGVADGGSGCWGVEDASWEASDGSAGGWGVGAAAAEGTAPSAFDFDDLNAALEAAQKAPNKAQQQSAVRTRQPRPDEVTVTSSPSTAPTHGCYTRACLPSFYLIAEAEPQAAAGKQLAKQEREHLQQLLLQYQQESGQELVDGSSNVSSSSSAGSQAGAAAAAAAAAGACLPSIEGTSDSWGGEGYEQDAVLHAPDKARQGGGVKPAYLKFTKRLAACPDQCARYSFGGTPLWPDDALPAPQPCAACGAPLVFELQLMAPAIHYLDESADWLLEGGKELDSRSDEAAGTADGGCEVLRPPASWEWATVAVYSCSRSCQPQEGAGPFVEEQVFVGNE